MDGGPQVRTALSRLRLRIGAGHAVGVRSRRHVHVADVPNGGLASDAIDQAGGGLGRGDGPRRHAVRGYSALRRIARPRLGRLGAGDGAGIRGELLERGDFNADLASPRGRKDLRMRRKSRRGNSSNSGKLDQHRSLSECVGSSLPVRSEDRIGGPTSGQENATFPRVPDHSMRAKRVRRECWESPVAGDLGHTRETTKYPRADSNRRPSV